MSSYGAALVAVWITWALLAASFYGLGWLVVRAAGLRARDAGAAFVVFWIGWGAALALLQAWHLRYPVDRRAAVLVAALGLGGFALAAVTQGPRGFAALRSLRASKLPLVAGALLALLLGTVALGPPQVYDTLLYHVQTVRWSSSHAVVPGLANLHGRLGFNSSYFLYSSMLEAGAWDGLSQHVGGGVLSLAVLFQLLPSFARLSQIDHGHWPRHFLAVLLLGPTLHAAYKLSSSFTPDLPVFLLGAVLSLLLFEMLLGIEPAGLRLRLFAILLLGAVGTTIKLNFVPAGATAAAVALFVAGRHARPRLAGVALLVVLAAVGAWIAHGIALSGHAVFPQTWSAVDVPWRVPEHAAEAVQRSISAWARVPGAPEETVLTGTAWVGPWAARVLGDALRVTVPLLLALVALAIVILRGERNHHSAAPWAVLLPGLATIVFVLVVAPEPRFAGAFPWVVAAGAMALALHDTPRSNRAFTIGRRLALGAGALVLAVVALKALRHVPRPGDEILARIESRPVRAVELPDGLRVWVPLEGDRTGDVPLPNAPHEPVGLRLRAPGDLQLGFEPLR